MDILTWIIICVTLIQSRIQVLDAEACDDGWLQHEGYCYYIATETVTWYEARDKCLEKDSTLTSILDNETNEFIIKNKDPNTEYWIGLKHIPSNDSTCCQWLDGSNSTWNIWGYNEPNGSGNCTRMAFKGKWRDTACNKNTIKYTNAGSHNISYICKKVPPSTTVRSVTGQRTTDTTTTAATAAETTTTTTTTGEKQTNTASHENNASPIPMEANLSSPVIPVSVGVVVVVFIIVLIIVAVVLVKRRKKSRQEQSREPTEDNIYSEPPTTSGDPSLEMLPSNELGHGRERQSVLSDGITNDAQDDVCYRNYAAVLSDRTATSSNDVINTSAQNVSELYAVVRKNREESSSGQSNNHVVAESDPEMGQMYVNVGEDPQESSMTFQDSSNVIHKSDEDISQFYAAVRKEKKIEDSSEVEMAENPNYTSYEG